MGTYWCENEAIWLGMVCIWKIQYGIPHKKVEIDPRLKDDCQIELTNCQLLNA